MGATLRTRLALAFAACGPREAAAPPRAARSVHLGYRAPDAVLFYNEMTVLQSTPGSYFMAAGWNTGYFGIQELSDGRKVILFSVWDPTPGDDPNAVKQEERVECLYNAPDVRIRRFGGEGTGGPAAGEGATESTCAACCACGSGSRGFSVTLVWAGESLWTALSTCVCSTRRFSGLGCSTGGRLTGSGSAMEAGTGAATARRVTTRGALAATTVRRGQRGSQVSAERIRK